MHRLAISGFHIFRGPLRLLWLLLLRPHPGRLPVSEGMLMSACFGVLVGMPVSMGVSARREARPTS